MKNQVNTVAKEATRTTDTLTKYTVSPDTAMFLDLLKGYNELYVNIVNVVEKCYGESQVDEIFDRDFNPIMSSLEDEIFEYLKYSIRDNIGSLNNEDTI
ncbi:MAG: hypothetical protein RSF93_07315 [Mucinivorans sp.]